MSDPEIGKGTGELSLGTVSHPLEPVHVPVQIIDGITTFGVLGSTVNMTLSTNRIGTGEDGKFKDEFVVAARLRFDIGIARMIRDALDVQIAMVEAPKGHAN